MFLEDEGHFDDSKGVPVVSPPPKKGRTKEVIESDEETDVEMKAEEEEDGILHKTLSNTNSPTIASARVHPSAQFEWALALVLLPSAMESIRVEVPPKSASAILQHCIAHCLMSLAIRERC